MTASVSAYLGVLLPILLALSVIIVMYYAETGFPWHTYATLITGYYASFGILILVPIDIGSVVVERRSTETDTDAAYDQNFDNLAIAYNVFFSLVLIFGSFVLVFEEYYNTDGYFSVFGRLWSAFKRMFYDSALGGVAGLIVLGILIGQKVVASNADALKLAAIVVTNTVYELFLMFLLAYALVEFPRSIWMQSNLDKYLLKVQMKAAAQFKEISETQLSVSLACADVMKTKTQLSSSRADQTLIDAVDMILGECPPEFRSARLGKPATNKKGQITIDTLAALRTNLNVCKDQYRMSQAKVEGTKILAYNLEDIVQAKNSSSHIIHWSLLDKDGTPQEYRWIVVYRPILLKVLSIVCCVLSLFSFLGVICSMHGVGNSVSVYFQAVHSDNSSIGGITVFIMITMGYTVYITVWSLFQIRLAGKQELVPRRTTPESLSFNVRMCARLAAPLAFFYLGWISENGIRQGEWQYNDAPAPLTPLFMPSAFSDFYQLQSIGIIKETFGTVFPIILFIVLGLVVLNVFNRLLVMMKLEKYQFGAEIVTEEQLREGKRQLLRHKKTTERTYRRDVLKSYILNIGKSKDGDTATGFFSRLLGQGSSHGKDSRPRDSSVSASSGAAEKFVPKEPAELSGTLERKASYKLGMKVAGMGGSGWKETWAEVRSPGFLHFYKDKAASLAALAQNSVDPSSSPDPSALVVDLRLIMDFKVPDKHADKKHKDNLELDLELSDDSIRLRLRNLAEVELWRSLLREWKDFNIDYGVQYPNGVKGGKVGSGGTGSASLSLRPSGSAFSNKGVDPSEVDLEEQKSQSRFSASTGVSSTAFSPLAKNSPTASARASEASSAAAGKGSASKGAASSSSGRGGRYDDDNNDSTSTGAAGIAAAGSGSGWGKPHALRGWLEKKGHAKVHIGSDWAKRFCIIDETSGSLIYYKSSNTSTEKPAGSIDLKYANDIAAPVQKAGKKGGSDQARFEIDMGEKVYKFRAESEEEGRRWVALLNEWKDYALMNMT